MTGRDVTGRYRGPAAKNEKCDNRAIESSGVTEQKERSHGPPGRDNCICKRIADAMLDYCASISIKVCCFGSHSSFSLRKGLFAFDCGES